MHNVSLICEIEYKITGYFTPKVLAYSGMLLKLSIKGVATHTQQHLKDDKDIHILLSEQRKSP